MRTYSSDFFYIWSGAYSLAKPYTSRGIKLIKKMATETSGAAVHALMKEGAAAAGNRKMRVMVAVDESEESIQALQWAIENIAAGREAAEPEPGLLTLVHVQQTFQHYGFPAGPGGTAFYTPTEVVKAARKAQEEISTKILSQALQICRDKMVRAETLVLEGDPKDMICQATEQMNIDLLVIGSRGLGRIKRAFLGSVSDYCAHHSKCPILIVKPSK